MNSGHAIVGPKLILITGIMAAGKSTVAQHLAECLPRSAHLRGDVFRRMIVGGRAPMGSPLSSAAYAQLQLRYRLAAAAAHLYLDAGFSIIYQDIIIGPELTHVVQHYRHNDLYVVVLCPAPEAVAARESGRPKKGYRESADIADFDRVLRRETPRLGLWLDNSVLTVAETVDAILTHLAAAQVRPNTI
jgi:predicted kinase